MFTNANQQDSAKDSYTFDPSVNKNIVICCDGTWNSPEQTDEGKIAPTNVCKIFNAIDSVDQEYQLPLAGIRSEIPQVRWYDQGVGVELGVWGRILSMAGSAAAARKGFILKQRLGVLIEGATGLGISENIREAYSWLCKVYRPGDRIYLFGFSRGAMQVRSLTGLIFHVGLLKHDYSSSTRVAFKRYSKLRSKNSNIEDLKPLCLLPPRMIHDPDRFKIHFLGVWDTVAALGIPIWGWSFEIFRLRTDYHDTTLVPIVQQAYHAVAMDEERSSFMPVLLMPNKNTLPGVLEQRWFRGAHADVGGGYARSGLSDIALRWIADSAEKAGLRFKPYAWTGLRPDAAMPLHSEVARKKSYLFTGLWPRMFALPEQENPLNSKTDVGKWHGSVVERHEKISRLGSRDWLKRLTENEGWSFPEPDPRENGWSELDLTEQRTIEVFADRLWSPTGVILREGITYRLSAHDEWIDLDDKTGPEGRNTWDAYRLGVRWYNPLTWFLSPRGIFWWLKRHPSAPWMQLIGMINHPTDWRRRTLPVWHLIRYVLKNPAELKDRQFAIGAETVITPVHTGPLYCFANDVWLFYGNNAGRVLLSIRILPDKESSAKLPPQDVKPGIKTSIVILMTFAFVAVGLIKFYCWLSASGSMSFLYNKLFELIGVFLQFCQFCKT